MIVPMSVHTVVFGSVMGSRFLYEQLGKELPHSFLLPADVAACVVFFPNKSTTILSSKGTICWMHVEKEGASCIIPV